MGGQALPSNCDAELGKAPRLTHLDIHSLRVPAAIIVCATLSCEQTTSVCTFERRCVQVLMIAARAASHHKSPCRLSRNVYSLTA